MTGRHARQTLPAAGPFTALAVAGGLLAGPALAQEAPVFSPTYAASQGSPYSDFYARTFGTTGKPEGAKATGTPVEAPPLETSAAPTPAASPAEGGDEVYVIEDGRLLTYRAEDYAGGGAAVDQAPLPPPATAYIGGTPEVRVPSIADRLYGDPRPLQPAFEAAPLDTAAGPIPLTPPAAPPAD